jgi:hypothetical protein
MNMGPILSGYGAMDRNSRSFEQTSQLQLYFQHNGATPHFCRHMMAYLSEQFPYQCTCHGDLQNWPTRSPDFTLLDFHVWGYMKNMVYECKLNRRQELLHQTFYAERCMNDPDVSLKVQIFLNFKYPELYNL